MDNLNNSTIKYLVIKTKFDISDNNLLNCFETQTVFFGEGEEEAYNILLEKITKKIYEINNKYSISSKDFTKEEIKELLTKEDYEIGKHGLGKEEIDFLKRIDVYSSFSNFSKVFPKDTKKIRKEYRIYFNKIGYLYKIIPLNMDIISIKENENYYEY